MSIQLAKYILHCDWLLCFSCQLVSLVGKPPAYCGLPGSILSQTKTQGLNKIEEKVLPLLCHLHKIIFKPRLRITTLSSDYQCKFYCNFTNVVLLLCSLSWWLYLNFSSVGTGFNGAETNCRIAHNLGILLMNSNCFAIFSAAF